MARCPWLMWCSELIAVPSLSPLLAAGGCRSAYWHVSLVMTVPWAMANGWRPGLRARGSGRVAIAPGWFGRPTGPWCARCASHRTARWRSAPRIARHSRERRPRCSALVVSRGRAAGWTGCRPRGRHGVGLVDEREGGGTGAAGLPSGPAQADHRAVLRAADAGLVEAHAPERDERGCLADRAMRCWSSTAMLLVPPWPEDLGRAPGLSVPPSPRWGHR